jgi:quercetin dioxygenase-like cupin family protein
MDRPAITCRGSLALETRFALGCGRAVLWSAPAMKPPLLRLAALGVAALSSSTMFSAESGNASKTPQPPKLASAVFDWTKLTPTPTPTGVRRDVFDAPTTTLDKVHCHITTLQPGADSGAPRRHLQEEIIIVKEGQVEAHIDGRVQTAGPGSVFFFAANAVTRLRNAGEGPATYIVIYYFTPLTPKS